MEQWIVGRKIVGRIAVLGRRPEFWLALLLVWVFVSAARSLGTPWASAAETEALRWGAGISLALALGWGLRRTEIAGQFLVTLTGAMALLGVSDGEAAVRSGLVGPYHDHQLYGSLLLLLLPFCAASALSARSAPWRWGALAALTAGSLCLLLSQTRSAWIGLLAAALVFGGLWLRRSASRPPRLRVVVFPLVLLAFALLAGWRLTEPAEQQAALSHRAATLGALSQDESWQSRLSLWRGAARMVAAHPALGIGLGRYPGSQRLWTRAGDVLPPSAHPSLSNEAHSFYGQTAAEIGLPGLALYLAALAAFAALGIRRLHTRRRAAFSPPDALLTAAVSALAGQSVDALASPSWQFPEVSLFFWAVLGLGLAALHRANTQAASAPLPRPVRRLAQWALSGSAAVALTAQILPLGLLTPVEAYDHLASNSFQSAAITQTPCSSGSGTCFKLTAIYTDGAHDVTFDNGGLSGYPSTFTCKVASSACSSTFGLSASRNQLTVKSGDSGRTLTITGAYEDGSFTSTPFVPNSKTYTARSASTTLVVP